MRNYPNFLNAFMEYASYVEAPEKFLRWSALSVLAGCLERKVWVTNGAATWYPNLYIMLVGEPGSRKSTGSEIAVDLLREVPGISFLADRLNEATFLLRLKSSGIRKTVTLGKEEFRHSACYLYASEAATSFSEMYAGGGIIVALTDLYNCGPRGWHNVHAWTKHTMKDGETQIFNPCVNLLACSTPKWLTTKVMRRDDIEGGFGSRVILVVQKGEYRRSFKWTQAGQAEVQMRTKLIQDLTHINKLFGPFTCDHTFATALEGFDEGHSKYLAANKNDNILNAYFTRKITHLIKLAQVISVSESDKLVLTSDHLVIAWKYLTELEEDMASVLEREEIRETLVIKQEVSHLTMIRDHIAKLGKSVITKAEVYSAFSNRMTSRQVSSAFKDMCASKFLEYMPIESSHTNQKYRVIGLVRDPLS